MALIFELDEVWYRNNLLMLDYEISIYVSLGMDGSNETRNGR